MSGWPRRGAADDRDDPQARTEDEAAAAATAIAGLRQRLARPSTLEHPAVRRELRQLDEQLAVQLDLSAHQHGRHRFPAGRSPGQPEPLPDDDTEQPGVNQVTAVVTGRDRGQDDPNACASAWQRITAASTTALGPQPAAAPVLQLLSGT